MSDENKTCEDLVEELRRKHKLDERCIPKTPEREPKRELIPIGLCE